MSTVTNTYFHCKKCKKLQLCVDIRGDTPVCAVCDPEKFMRLKYGTRISVDMKLIRRPR